MIKVQSWGGDGVKREESDLWGEGASPDSEMNLVVRFCGLTLMHGRLSYLNQALWNSSPTSKDKSSIYVTPTESQQNLKIISKSGFSWGQIKNFSFLLILWVNSYRNWVLELELGWLTLLDFLLSIGF